jgi:hypothetical protein
MAHAAQQQAPAACWCATCRPVSFGDMRMVLCPVCGNKRCPRASNHIYACTGSNEVGQVGVDVADMAHRAPHCLKYGANMSPEEIEAIAQRPTYCKADGEAVTLSRAERDSLVAMARRYAWLRDRQNDAVHILGLYKDKEMDLAIDDEIATDWP